ncbi:MAG: hypothetical protein OXI39_15605 [Gemmatimonadota bacterium]|uniref:hypothetical protein n=1 Tax=Candidatus Palauibacter scopulicola TaxID=3056741 RepID=UPI0023950169|nr:hypothetical protein [Candidatus Palauibacter scopulicola]MDE2664413.1 hypothetical protein [Candidatus Palauibacter scopulicola]
MAVGTIPAHNVDVGGSVSVSALNGYFSDPDGDALTFTAASSNDGVATVSVDGTSAMVSGVARGSAVVTITAADPDGLQANQGFNVEVGQDGGRPATVTIFGLRQVDDRNTSVDPTNVSGDVSVLLDVQYNDETVTNVDLMLGDEVISCRGASSDAASPAGVVPGVAESGGSVEIECFFDTDQVAGECMGMQMEPRFANGDHELSAQITTSDGTTRTALASQMITLKNSNYVMLAHSKGSESMVTGGVTFYGGPAGEDESNVNSFHACPVAFNGTVVGELSLHAMVTGPEASALEDAPPALAFSALPNGTPRNGVALADKEAPFTWTVNPGINWNVENTAGKAMGNNEHWLINSGDIKDDGGLLVTDEFRGDDEAKLGPRYFDYKGPTFDTAAGDRGISLHLGGTTVVPVANTYYSAGNFRVNGLADAGVGGASAKFAVGDCSVGANSDGDRRTAFVALEGLGDVSGIGDLPEDDPNADFDDDDGANCYVAEVTAIYDGLMNARSARSGNSTIQTGAAFGVDKGDPELSDIEPDEAGLVLRAGAMLSLDVEDPKLATGEPGSGIGEVRWWVGSRSYTHPLTRVKGTATVSDGAVEINTDLTAAASSSGEGARTVNVQARDSATPVNASSTTFSFIRDTKAPTFTLSKTQGDISPQSATAVTVSVGGTISDNNVIRSAELQLRRKATGQSCMAADTIPRREGTNARVSRNRVDLENDTNAITFDETFTINAPAGAGTGPEALCFYLDSEDNAVEPNGRDAGNEGDYVLNEFTVNWPTVAAPPPGPTFEFMNVDGTEIDTVKVTEGDATGFQYAVSLANTDTDTVAVTVTGPAGVTVAPATLNFPNTDTTSDTLIVTVTTAHDLDIMANHGMVTHSATDFESASVAVQSNDDDFAISTDVASINEDASATEVTVTVTAGTAPAAETTTTVSVNIGYPTGDAETTPAPPTSVDVVIAAGMKSGEAEVMVDALDDAVRDEVSDMIELTVSGSAEQGVYYMPASIDIMDDDPDITLSLDVTEVDEDAGTVTVEITGTTDVQVNGILNFAVALGGTATRGAPGSTTETDDYRAPETVALQFNTGGTTASATVTLEINDDGTDEANETIIFDDADGAQVAGAGKTYTVGPVTLTINDNDDA